MTGWNTGSDYPLRESGAIARGRAWNIPGVPDPQSVVRCTIGGPGGVTTFEYDDGRDPWVLPGIEEVRDAH